MVTYIQTVCTVNCAAGGLTLGGIVAGEGSQRWGAASVDSISTAPSDGRRATYAANSGHLEAGRAPRSAIEPRELSCEPARERSVVVAGIVSGCAEFYSGVTGTERRRDLWREAASCWQ